jgi:hypothetical protein
MLRRAELEAKEPAGDGQHAFAHAVVGKVGAHRLGVEVVGGPSHALGVVAALPGLHHARARRILSLAIEQLPIVGLDLSSRRGDHAVDELAGGRGAGGHAVFEVIARPIAIAERVRDVGTHRQQAVDHRHVVGISDVL